MADILDVKLGSTQVNKIYCGSDLVFEKAPPDTTAPITSIRPYDAIGNPTNTYDTAQTVYLDCNEMADTYYTLDGSTPTVASTHYVGDGIPINDTTTIKYFSVDVAGNVEAVKTTVYTINVVQVPITTISPTNTTQNNFPITVTLSSDDVGATIYYKIGAGVQQTYSAPFQVTQTDVWATNIPVTYWSVGEGGTEAERTITYDTSGAIPSQPTVTVTNEVNQVTLNWGAGTNTIAFSVYKSTVQGQAGTKVIDNLFVPTWTDTSVTGGTTYYYMVQAGNMGQINNSVQKSATPLAPPTFNYRYVKVEGYGAAESGQEATTRMIELQVWSGATNLMKGALSISWDIPDNTTKPPISSLYDDNFTTTSNTYPFWWTATPNANVVIDFQSQKNITKLSYFGYSTAGVPRTNRFKFLASNTNNGTDWVTIWDNQTGQAGVQPALPSGYEKVL